MIEFLNKAEVAKKKKSERMKIYYQNNKESRKLKSKEYRDNNKDAFNRYRNNYRTKTANGIYDVIKQGAKKRGVEFLITKEWFADWYNSQEKKCCYCDRTEDDVIKDESIIRKKMTRLTIDRVVNLDGYKEGNLTLACMRCNSIKSNFFTYDEMILIGKIINTKSKCQK